MAQIGTIGRLAAARIDAVGPVRPAADPTTEAVAARALVALDGGRRDGMWHAAARRDGRPEAGFVAQLLVGADPSLRPSRLERTREAAARYAETARLLA